MPMDEREWLACEEPALMFGRLQADGVARSKEGRRKLRLFAGACCRHFWGLLRNKRSRQTVLILEQFADDGVGAKQRENAHDEAKRAHEETYQSHLSTPHGAWCNWMARCEAAKMVVRALASS